MKKFLFIVGFIFSGVYANANWSDAEGLLNLLSQVYEDDSPDLIDFHYSLTNVGFTVQDFARSKNYKSFRPFRVSSSNPINNPLVECQKSNVNEIMNAVMGFYYDYDIGDEDFYGDQDFLEDSRLAQQVYTGDIIEMALDSVRNLYGGLSDVLKCELVIDSTLYEIRKTSYSNSDWTLILEQSFEK